MLSLTTIDAPGSIDRCQNSFYQSSRAFTPAPPSVQLSFQVLGLLFSLPHRATKEATRLRRGLFAQHFTLATGLSRTAGRPMSWPSGFLWQMRPPQAFKPSSQKAWWPNPIIPNEPRVNNANTCSSCFSETGPLRHSPCTQNKLQETNMLSPLQGKKHAGLQRASTVGSISI